jgi:hypothetical protein
VLTFLLSKFFTPSSQKRFLGTHLNAARTVALFNP